MKKIFSLFMAVVMLCTSYAATPSVTPFSLTPSAETPVLNARNIMLPIGHTGKTISMMDLATISIKDFQALSGTKLSLFGKIGFKIGQKKLRSNLEDDGTIKSGAIKKYANKMAADGESGFHFGGFALGFFLGLIGVLIAYLIKDDKKSNRVKWAWIGLGVIVVLSLIAALA